MENRKSIILFINGFSEKSDKWTILESNIQSDPKIQKNYDLYSYDCSKIWKEEWTKYGDFENVYRNFDEWIQEKQVYRKLRSGPKNNNCDLFFIGSGLGSLLVLNHVRRLLNKEEKAINFDYLRLIREIILISPPVNGVTIQDIRELTIEKKGFFQKSRITSKKFINYLNNQVSSIYNFTVDNIINADDYNREKCPIPIAVIASENDMFFTQKPIWANAKAWISISSNQNESTIPAQKLEAVKRLLSNPIGHRNIFEIQDCVQIMRVEPFLEGKREIFYGNKSKIVECNSIGNSTRKVTFSRNNICHKPFLLRYATTSKGGGLIGMESPQGSNIASAEMRGRYLKDAKEYVFQFIPKNEDDNIYTLDIEIYKGMDLPNGTNVHYHLYKGTSFYNNFLFKLDLSSYLDKGYKLTKGPFLYLISEDLHSCNETYKDRIKENLINPLAFDDKNGVWEWKLTKQRTGVIDVIWGIEEKEDLEKVFSGIRKTQKKKDDSHLFDLKKDLVETLYRCDTLAFKERRELFIRELPFGGEIKVSGIPLEDIFYIVNHCVDSKDRFEVLLNSLKFFEGDTYIIPIIEEQINILMES